MRMKRCELCTLRFQRPPQRSTRGISSPLRHKLGCLEWQPMILRDALDLKWVWQKDKATFTASPRDTLTLPAWLRQSPWGVTDSKKKQRKKKKSQYSTPGTHTRVHTHSPTGESLPLHLEKPPGLTCFLHICSLNNNKIITHSVFES